MKIRQTPTASLSAIASAAALAALLAACSQPEHGTGVSHDAASGSPKAVAAPAPPPAAAPVHALHAEAALADRAAPQARRVAVPASLSVPVAPELERVRQVDSGREKYDEAQDNPVKRTVQESVSTLSLDVDTGAYSNVRRFLNQGRLPPKDAVRVEELINYFPYNYPQPAGAHPFATSTELAASPWNSHNLILRVGVKAVEQNVAEMPPANLVFLVDVSGSMNAQDKLPLVQATLRLLVQQLRPQDKVSLVTYSGRTNVELEPTSGREKDRILAAIARLQAGGATAGGAALELAYQQALVGFVEGGINRILLATDGDFNVGVSDVSQIRSMVERQRAGGISLTTLGYGQGNYNEALMQQIAQVGNGNYSYIDSLGEARKVLVEELSSTFNSVAADVKLQLEFNPATVAEWRLIGYENRLLDEADFRNDKVDAVEIGAGKSVTALYELTLVGQPTLHAERRYGHVAPQAHAAPRSNELAQLRIRYKKPGEDQGIELDQVIAVQPNPQPGADWKFATAVAGFGQLLRGGTHTGNWTYDDVKELAQQGYGDDPQGYRRDFVKLVELANSLQTP